MTILDPEKIFMIIVFWTRVDFGADFAIDSIRVAWLRHHYGYVKRWWSLGIGIGIG